MSPAAQSLLGISEAIEELRKTINLVAPADLGVLIQGETGTGKELVARAIHDSSRRARGPLIDVNCASLPESLAEAELFGHEKGAFTGADRPRKGHFEQAHGGTLFLDEVGELSPQLQPKLLRVLELREVRRIGGAYSVAVDFRLIMATHRNLEDMVRTGKFREDLYHRMNVCSIRTPALRDRTDDILLLAHHFAGQYARETDRAVRCFSADVLNLFLGYPWPGNVRELQNVVRQTVLTSKKDIVEVADLPFEFLRKTVAANVKLGIYHHTMKDVSRRLCVYAITAARGSWRQAARLLGIPRSTFHRIAKSAGLEDPTDSRQASFDANWDKFKGGAAQ
jgi:transcriptional regulator with GAF, ATPase, and Fis domain